MRKHTFVIFILVLLLFCTACGQNDKTQGIPKKLEVFHKSIAQNEWDTQDLAAGINEQAENLVLQNISMTWDMNDLKEVYLKIRIADQKRGYSIAFNSNSGTTTINKIDDLEKLEVEVNLKEIFNLFKKHGLHSLQGSSNEDVYNLLLDITQGNQRVTNEGELKGMLFKVSLDQIVALEPNETFSVENTMVSFHVNSNIYIIEELSN